VTLVYAFEFHDFLFYLSPSWIKETAITPLQHDHCKGVNHCPSVDQGDDSASLGGGGAQHRKEEPRGNKNGPERHSDSNAPKERLWKHRRVREYSALSLF
jgi:hypothetical protein